MVEILAFDDLPLAIQSGELVQTMLDGVNAKAARVAPCLAWAGGLNQPAPSVDQLAEAKLVLIGAVKRWAEAGAGALSAQTAGPFGMTVDTRQRTGYNLWPSEISGLQDICKTGGTSDAFSVDTVGCGTSHLPWCSLALGALYCSCGVDIAGAPIFGLG